MGIEEIFKLGSSSIVIGSNYYKKFVSFKKDKLLKISKISKNYNNFNLVTKEIRKIDNYSDFYCIPDETTFLLNPTNNFYIFLENLILDTHPSFIDIFKGSLHYNYINNVGDRDLLDSIDDIITNSEYNIWNSYKTIIYFCHHILMGLSFLHTPGLPEPNQGL